MLLINSRRNRFFFVTNLITQSFKLLLLLLTFFQTIFSSQFPQKDKVIISWKFQHINVCVIDLSWIMWHVAPQCCTTQTSLVSVHKISPQSVLLFAFEIIPPVSASRSLRLYFWCFYTNRLSLLNIFSNETDVFFDFLFRVL